MKQFRIPLCSVLTFILLLGNIHAQSFDGSFPPSYQSAVSYADIQVVNAVPADAQFIADAKGNTNKSGMYVIAQLRDVDVSPVEDGDWETLENGNAIWRVKLRSPGAKALALHFDRFNIPAGGKVYVYDEGRTQLLGTFTEKDNTGDLGYSIGLILGDCIVFEYDAPELLSSGAKKAILNEDVVVPDIHISQLSYIFRGVEDLQNAKEIGDSESCEVNVKCPEGDNWDRQIRSVVRIYVVQGNSAGWCSGTLINNLTSDGTPYILTANHCGPDATTSNFNQWKFYFNLQYTSCTGTTIQAQNNVCTGCSKKAEGSIDGGSDFYLLQLNQAPNNAWNPIYAGWRRDNTAATTATGIHHPAGDVKKISSSTTISTGSYTGCASSAHWKISDWRQTATNQGVTEGGSSGSGLWDQNGYLVGTLTGGQASCSYPHNDYYGKLYYHWDQNGTSSSQQAKPWLDPNNTGSTTCPDYDPNNPDSPATPDTTDTPGTPDTPDTPGASGNCHKAHYPLHGTLVSYKAEENGYLAGTNSYGDKAKADYFTKDATTEYIVNLTMNFAQASGTGSVTFCIWADNNGVPGELLGSRSVSLSSITSHSVMVNDPQMASPYPSLCRRYTCQFPTSIAVSGNFFAGVQLPNSGTFSLVTNSNGDGANTGWEQKSDGTWVPYNDSSSWGLSLTHALFPQLCDNANTTEIEEEIADGVSIYPNPTSGNVIVRLSDARTANATVEVYDYTGKLVKAPQMRNELETTIQLGGCAQGIYTIVVRKDNVQIITKKISLIH